MITRLCLVALLSVAVLRCEATAQENVSTNDIFSSNKDIQACLRGLVSPDDRHMFSGTEEEFQQQLTHLDNIVGRDHKTLVRELLYFSLHAKGMREAMLPGVVIHQLSISKDDIALGVLPFLDSKGKVQAKACNWLGEVDAGSLGNGPDFSHYETIIRKRKDSLPGGLVKYMYQKSPDRALSSLANVYLDKVEATALVDQVKSEDDTQAVGRLSKRPEWWVQLYVVEKLCKNPKLRSTAILDRVKQSNNPLVKESVGKIEKK